MTRLPALVILVASFALAACSSSDPSGPGGNGGGGQSGGDDCSPTMPCEQGFFCDYADDRCGQGDPTGKCRQAPISDCGLAPLACGCDGKVAESCDGAVGFANAVDVAQPSMCPAPAGKLACGEYYCDPSLQYCQGSLNLDSCSEEYTCAPIPGTCSAAPTCDCISMADDVFSCSGDAQSGFTGDLPGGDSPSCP